MMSFVQGWWGSTSLFLVLPNGRSSQELGDSLIGSSEFMPEFALPSNSKLCFFNSVESPQAWLGELECSSGEDLQTSINTMASSPARIPSLLLISVALLWITGAAGEDKECTARLARIQPCIGYLNGSTNTPGSRCCRGLVYIYQHTPVCLCELLSSTGGVVATPGINVSNAVMLPTHCKIGSNTSACPTLLVQHSGVGQSPKYFSDVVRVLMATLVPSFMAGLIHVML